MEDKMKDLFKRLENAASNKILEPREIFMSLPAKEPCYQYSRDVQSDVWKKWFEQRDAKNTIIKMNTGSGKTVVGLMILKSCLNEGKGPAVYVVPDHFLERQVLLEAKKLGIKATTDRDDYYYTECQSILIMPIQSLVNGRSAFGINKRQAYPIGSIVIDDVHACLDTISSQFMLKIPYTHDLYNELVEEFRSSLSEYGAFKFNEIVERNYPNEQMLIPFWIWQQKHTEVYKIIQKYENDEETNKFVFFSLPLLKESFSTCNCILTSRYIEITPKGIPIDLISSFESAKRRIFMSATLADDSVFVSTIGLNENEIGSIITPEKANDVGDRLLLFPKHLNNAITDEEIKNNIVRISKQYNVVVIVPSSDRAEFWRDSANYIVNKDNISDVVDKLKNGHVGLVILINRYDGVDLPNDACRMLVIDSLPPLRNEYDKYLHSINANREIYVREQIQRIEQGMGRGVRSPGDSCCVVYMGDNLADVLLRQKGYSYFSQATIAQFELSKNVWALVKEDNESPTVEEVFEIANYSLERNTEWIKKSRETLSTVAYSSVAKINPISISLRKAYEAYRKGMTTDAIKEMDKIINSVDDSDSKGYLMQVKAEYTNLHDASKAQQILSSAKKESIRVLTPIVGIQYDKVINNATQPKAINDYLTSNFKDSNEFLLFLQGVLERLDFSADANTFEQSIKELGIILGFKSTRPDQETNGAGPDNLWAVGNNHYWVIECKNEAVSETICKEYCNQLGGSIRWLHKNYGDDCKCTPILIHNADRIDELASAVEGMRVITNEELNKLKANVRGFGTSLSSISNWGDEQALNRLLMICKLKKDNFLEYYSKNTK